MQVEIKITLAKNGTKTANMGNLRIHSAYNPQREAERFIEPLIKTMRQGCTVVLIGTGLGYLDSVLSNKRPDLCIVSCHLLSVLYENRVNTGSSVHCWHPGSRQPLYHFLSTVIKEVDVPGLRIVEWPATAKIVTDTARFVSKTLAALIRFHTGNISTTVEFGRLWLRNCIRNYLEIDQIAALPQEQGLTVIAASGPSLEAHLNTLILHRAKFSLWALPSSLRTLNHAGLRPDMIFTTDPGFWSRFHNRYFPSGIPVAMPLTASPLPTKRGPVVLLNQKSLGENALLGNGWNAIPIPQAGTVAITAIETWRLMGFGSLVLAGLDLSWLDLKSHCRPHTFDNWINSFDGRTSPTLTSLWKRARKLVPEKLGKIRTGSFMKTYADWFQEGHFVLPVYRLTDKEEEQYPLPNVLNVNRTIFSNFRDKSHKQYRTMPVPITYQKRQERVSQQLQQWKEMASNPEANWNSELYYNLDPGGVLDISRLGKAVTYEDRLKHYRCVQNKLAGLIWKT